MKHKIHYLFLTILLLAVCTTHAQKDTIAPKHAQQRMIAIKYSPFSLFGDYMTPSTGIQLGVEYQLGKRWSVEQDVDYIFKYKKNEIITEYYSGLLKFKYKKIRGLRTDTEIKFFLKEKEKKISGFYIACHLMYQYTYAEKNYNVLTDFIDYYVVNKNIIGLHAKFGRQLIIGKSKGLVIDMGLGFGVRFFISNTIGNLPNQYLYYETTFSKKYRYDTRYEDKHSKDNFFSISANCKIGLFNKLNSLK